MEAYITNHSLLIYVNLFILRYKNIKEMQLYKAVTHGGLPPPKER